MVDQTFFRKRSLTEFAVCNRLEAGLNADAATRGHLFDALLAEALGLDDTRPSEAAE